MRRHRYAGTNCDEARRPDRVHASERSQRDQIYVVDANGSVERPLTAAADDALGPVWSPDGTQIAYNFTPGPLCLSARSEIHVVGFDPSWQALPARSG